MPGVAALLTCLPGRPRAGAGNDSEVAVQTFAEVVRARKGDDKVGVRFEDRQWTWDEVVQQSADRAAALVAAVPAPAGRQRHIGVLLENVPDFVFWIGAGALAGAFESVYEWYSYYPEWAFDHKLAYLGFFALSGAVVAGLGSWLLVRALARAGVLDAFPAGRELAGED